MHPTSVWFIPKGSIQYSNIKILTLPPSQKKTNTMKTLLSLKSALAILIIAFFAGCAGITEANLAETETTFDSADTPIVHSELPGFFNSGDQEDMIDVPPKSSRNK
jgi:hypothetical protein